MNELLKRLSSRTFWIAIASFIGLMANDQYNEAAGVVIAYILAEKGKDAVEVAKGLKTPYISSTVVENDDVDRSKIVTGVGSLKPSDSE